MQHRTSISSSTSPRLGRRIPQTLLRGLSLTTEQAAALAGRLVPTVLVDDLTRPWQSDEFTEQWGVFGGTLGAVAAETGQYALVNPAGSGKLVVLHEVSFGSGGDSDWGVALLNETTTVSGIAQSSTRATLDGRWLRTTTSTGQRGLVAVTRAESDAQLVPESALWHTDVSAINPSPFVILDAILSQNQTLLMEQRTANLASRLWYRWFEIPLEPGSQGGLG